MSSISPTNGITCPLLGEAQLKQAALHKSLEVITAVSKEKLNTIAGFHVTDTDVITRIVTNETDATVLKPYQDRGVEVITMQGV